MVAVVLTSSAQRVLGQPLTPHHSPTPQFFERLPTTPQQLPNPFFIGNLGSWGIGELFVGMAESDFFGLLGVGWESKKRQKRLLEEKT